MGKKEDFNQVLGRHPCVNLCGGDPSVAQHYLDRPQVRSAFDHVRCRRVTQGVGRHRGGIYSGLGCGQSNDPEYRHPAEPPTPEVREHRIPIRAVSCDFQPVGEPGPDRLDTRRSERNLALAVAFARDDGGHLLEIESPQIETNRLCDPSTGAVKKLEQRSVPTATGRADIGRFD